MNLTRATPKKPAGKVTTDDMIQSIEVINRKVQNEVPLMDGVYTIITISNRDRTYKEWCEFWFSIIDEFSSHVGSDRYTVHEAFKAHLGISSTKDIENWDIAIHKLKKWCLINS